MSEPARRSREGFASPATPDMPGRCIACEHYNPKVVGGHWQDDRGLCMAAPDGRISVGACDGCWRFTLVDYAPLRAIHEGGYA